MWKFTLYVQFILGVFRIQGLPTPYWLYLTPNTCKDIDIKVGKRKESSFVYSVGLSGYRRLYKIRLFSE